MPTRLVGRTTYQRGKKLFDILSQLKNFGVGRVVYRNSQVNGHPNEVSYYVVRSVEPDMKDLLQTKAIDQTWHKATMSHVYRGEDQGIQVVNTGFKPDWRLVPKDEEHKWLNAPMKVRPRTVVPRTLPMPPLLAHFVKQDMKELGMEVPEKPRMKFNVKYEGETVFEDELENPAHPKNPIHASS